MDIIERLRAVAEEGYTFAGEAADEIARLRAELAAAQACVSQMRDALRGYVCGDTEGGYETFVAEQLLTTLFDDAALRARLKEERERCACRCEDDPDADGRWCAVVIRNLRDE